jgi:predicted nucleic acid-binding protein
LNAKREKLVAAKSHAFTLDSYALLAYLEGEKAMPRIKELMQSAESGNSSLYLSLINLGEVLSITERERGRVRALQTLAAIDQLPMHIPSVSRATVLEAAHIEANYAISYADAFAVVTAREHDCMLLTGDPEFHAVADDGLIAVEWLPR